MYTPDDLPLAAGIGTNGGPLLSSSPVDQTEFKWMDESHLFPQSTLVGTIVAADTTFDVTAGQGIRFRANDLISMTDPTNAASAETEIMRVVSVSTDELTVTRDYDNSMATHGEWSAGAVIRNLGNLQSEGSTPAAAQSVDRVVRSNYTRIYGPEKVDMSRTTQRVPRYGVPSEFAHQTRISILRMLQQREQDFLYGKRLQSSAIRMSGGLAYWLSKTTDAAGAITETVLETALQGSYDEGGRWNVLIANPKALKTLSDTDNTNRVRQEINDPVRGRIPVSTVMTQFGEIQVVHNRYCDVSDAFGVFSSGLTRRVLDPLQMHRLAKTGDSDQVMLVLEEGLEVKGADHMRWIQNITE